MIHIELPGTMQCEEEGCTASRPVRLYLAGSGAFVFGVQKKEEGEAEWQIMLPQGPAGLGAPFKTRCPQHQQLVATAAGRRSIIPGLQVGSADPRMKPNGGH